MAGHIPNGIGGLHTRRKLTSECIKIVFKKIVFKKIVSEKIVSKKIVSEKSVSECIRVCVCVCVVRLRV